MNSSLFEWQTPSNKLSLQSEVFYWELYHSPALFIRGTWNVLDGTLIRSVDQISLRLTDRGQVSQTWKPGRRNSSMWSLVNGQRQMRTRLRLWTRGTLLLWLHAPGLGLHTAGLSSEEVTLGDTPWFRSSPSVIADWLNHRRLLST